MGSGSRLEHADEAAPDGTADDACDQDEQEVEAHRQVQGEAHPGGKDAGHDDLALGTDVEQARTEGQCDAEAGRNQRRGDGEGFHQRRELSADAVPPRVEHRALEERDVGAGGR